MPFLPSLERSSSSDYPKPPKSASLPVSDIPWAGVGGWNWEPFSRGVWFRTSLAHSGPGDGGCINVLQDGRDPCLQHCSFQDGTFSPCSLCHWPLSFLSFKEHLLCAGAFAHVYMCAFACVCVWLCGCYGVHVELR